MNAVQLPMLPTNYDGHPTTTVTYQPTYTSSASRISRRTKNIIIVIIIGAILVFVAVIAETIGLFNLFGEKSKGMNKNGSIY